MRSLVLGLAAALAVLAGPAFAQEMRTFEHDLGVTEIPVHPQRIVSLHDLTVTIPLIELGAPIVGSMGRVDNGVEPFIRSSMSLTGVDFATSDIAFIGQNPIDLEAVAALEPDLIILASQPGLDYAQLSQIAPTVVIENVNHPGLEKYRMIADAAGALDRFEKMEARFEGQIAELRRLVPDAADIRVSVIVTGSGTVAAYRDYGGLTYVLDAVGFGHIPAVEGIPDVSIALSAEQLQEIDGDFIFASYRNDQGQTPQTELDKLEAVLPGFCAFLQACTNRQLILMPRDEMAAISFRAFDLIFMTIASHIAGREFVPFQP